MLQDTRDSEEEFKRRATFVILFALGAFLFIYAVWIARVILLLLFASILCALLLVTVTNWVHTRLTIPRSLALMLVTVCGAGVLVLGISLRGSAIVEQFVKLQLDLPIAAHKLLRELEARDWGRWLLDRFSDSAQQFGGLTFALSRIGGMVLSSVTAVTGLFVVTIASLYFAAEPESYLNGLRLIVPLAYRANLERALSNAARQLRWWLLAKLISMAAVGVMVSTG